MFSSHPKTVKNSKNMRSNGHVYASHENMQTDNLFYKKDDKYDELESIEKDRDIFSTISIEQDIANLDNLGTFGKEGEHFVLEFDECYENNNYAVQKSNAANDQKSDTKSLSKKQPHQVRGYQQKQGSELHPAVAQNNTPADQTPKTPKPSTLTEKQEEELNNKKKIMEYLKIVKEKSSMWATKLEGKVFINSA